MGLRPSIVRSARLTARTFRCPGCFASLRSGRGAAPLAPLCGYPCKLDSGERFVNHSPLPSQKNFASLHRPLTKKCKRSFLRNFSKATTRNVGIRKNLKASRKQLERNERRIVELKRLFIKIYEDNAMGKLNDERFDMMSQSYETEQKQLEAEVIVLRQEIDPYMLRELIQAIYVEAPDKPSGKRRQNIHIKYDGIGFRTDETRIKQRKTAWLTPRRPLKTNQFSAFFKITFLRPPPIRADFLCLV
jgi:hypothetical protein